MQYPNNLDEIVRNSVDQNIRKGLENKFSGSRLCPGRPLRGNDMSIVGAS
jgi:hypothetical protein